MLSIVFIQYRIRAMTDTAAAKEIGAKHALITIDEILIAVP